MPFPTFKSKAKTEKARKITLITLETQIYPEWYLRVGAGKLDPHGTLAVSGWNFTFNEEDTSLILVRGAKLPQYSQPKTTA